MKLDESAFYPLKTSESAHQNCIFFKTALQLCHGFANSIVYMIESVYSWNSFPPHSAQIRPDGALVILYLSHYYMYC